MSNLNNKLLASLAVFRSLDKEGKSINVILSEFLMDIIKSKQLHQFTASEIGSNLEEIYDFQIPDAVIRTALRKIDFIVVKNYQYTVSDTSKLKDYNLDEQQNIMFEEYSNILKDLFVYIKNKQQSTLSVEDEQKIEQAFVNFILDNAIDNGYSNFISAFIIDNKNDGSFMATMDLIKEGVILYTGLKFNPHMNLNSPWQSDLIIYLNTEIIFHLVGYNGELYKELFDDFYSLVKDVNRVKKHIRLKYFTETKEEIESFFYAAEKIIQGDNSLSAASAAMRMLVNGSKDSIDILTKKAQLFKLLETYGIQEEANEDIYTKENYKYNIPEQMVIDKYIKEFDGKYNVEYIQNIVKKLNFFSIKRAEREKNNFENIGYILLTENSKINMIAWDDDIKNRGDVPLATNLQFITNKLWFKLNKGFGKGDYPTSFKVITKAQTLLASHLSDTLRKEYKELQRRVDSGEMTEEVALTVLYELRSRSKMPEDLYDSDMTSVLATISEKKLDDYALQYENTIKKAKEKEKKNKELEQELKHKEEEKRRLQTEKESSIQEREELEKIIEKIKQEKEQEKLMLKKYLLMEKDKNRTKLVDIKNKIDDKAEKKYKNFKSQITSGFIIYYVLIIVAIYLYGWDVMEKWTWIFSFAIPILFSMIYLFIKEKKLDIPEILQEKQSQIRQNLYKENNLDLVEIEKLSKEIEDLNNELNNQELE